MEKYLSIGSVWEMTIKVSIGKLQLKSPIDTVIEKSLATNAIRLLNIIAQALSEHLPIVSSDANFDRYGIERI